MTDATFPCVQCGSAVPRSAQFCLVCGTPVSSRSQSAALGGIAGQAPAIDRAGAPIDGWRPTPAVDPIRPGDLIPSGYGRRVVAFLVDGLAGVVFWLIVVLPLLALGVIDVLTTESAISVSGLSAVLLMLPALVVPLANLLLQSFLGWSLGLFMMGLRIVNVSRLGKPGLGWMLLRSAFVAAATLVFGIGQWIVYLSPLWDGEKAGRGWHDKLARTWIIDVKAGPNPLKARPGQLLLEGAWPLPEPAVAPYVPAPRGAAPAAPTAGAAAAFAASATPGPLPTPAPRVEPISSVPGFAPSAAAVTPAELAGDDFESTRLTDSGRPPITAGVTQFVLDTGERVPITRHGVLGRDPVSPTGDPSDILIALTGDTLSVSKTHLEFGVDGGAGSPAGGGSAGSGVAGSGGGSVWVSDRGSTNGTAIVRGDGAEYVLDPGERITVVPGDRVRVGTRLLSVSIDGGTA